MAELFSAAQSKGSRFITQAEPKNVLAHMLLNNGRGYQPMRVEPLDPEALAKTYANNDVIAELQARGMAFPDSKKERIPAGKMPAFSPYGQKQMMEVSINPSLKLSLKNKDIFLPFAW
jgi:hypothetical protein